MIFLDTKCTFNQHTFQVIKAVLMLFEIKRDDFCDHRCRLTLFLLFLLV